MSNDIEAIRGLLAAYERSLNTSNADLAASCYASDGVFMPTMLPTAAGVELRAAYANVFASIKLNVAFSIDELVITGNNLAYALEKQQNPEEARSSYERTLELDPGNKTASKRLKRLVRQLGEAA